jgi:hypothetical protein
MLCCILAKKGLTATMELRQYFQAVRAGISSNAQFKAENGSSIVDGVAVYFADKWRWAPGGLVFIR